MVKRLLDACASDFLQMTAGDLVESIRQAEGRSISAEVICTDQSPIDGVSHGEIAAAMGADIIILDRYDCSLPVIQGAPRAVMESTTPLLVYKQILGRPVGINLLVGDPSGTTISPGRFYSPENLEILVRQGVDILFLYSNPSYRGSFESVLAAVEEMNQNFAGKVLLVGVPSFYQAAPRSARDVEKIMGLNARLLQAGCQSIALLMPGSKQGWLFDPVKELIDHIHSLNGLAWLVMTASVEGGPAEMMVQMAYDAKMLGADLYRLDEAGLSGMPAPMNIFKFSMAIRGERHTYRRMALSARR